MYEVIPGLLNDRNNLFLKSFASVDFIAKKISFSNGVFKSTKIKLATIMKK